MGADAEAGLGTIEAGMNRHEGARVRVIVKVRVRVSLG